MARVSDLSVPFVAILICLEHHHCDFYRFFPDLHQHSRILAVIPLSARSPDLSALSRPSTLNTAAAKTTKGRQSRKKGQPCPGVFCK